MDDLQILVVATLEGAIAELYRKNKELELSLRKAESLAARDALTGLYNRRHFSHALGQLFADAVRHRKDLSCVMIDLDHYKQLNDEYGHQVGDDLLVLAAKCIEADLRGTDVAARYGGDEFVLLLPRTGRDEAAGAAARIREEYRLASGRLLREGPGVGMSMGVASIRANGVSGAAQLLAVADTALYSAKRSRRGGGLHAAASTSVPCAGIA